MKKKEIQVGWMKRMSFQTLKYGSRDYPLLMLCPASREFEDLSDEVQYPYKICKGKN